MVKTVVNPVPAALLPDMIMTLLVLLTEESGQSYVAHLACRDATDEHFQIFRAAEYRRTDQAPMPTLLITPDGNIELHPDRPGQFVDSVPVFAANL